ncbi:XRE family transcriptional regulator [Nocardia panacis]|uniref:XRE family transcriptional regulator n=1 Tax=Nocardia panacis TaxID=2340916 RepID=A0A3A4JZ33_9NOCA|nr:helix-turn-helix domain-containing protein [Nocardia panacis]RJO69816.1 XRE family transcriptional regulator [Nocardia panacis]
MAASLRFGTFVRERRRYLGISREDLARRTQWSRATIEKIEQSTRPPTVDTLMALFDALLIPTMYREQLFSLMYPGAIQEMYGPLPDEPFPSDLIDLGSYPYPAAFLKLPEADVIATSPSWPLTLPGLVAGSNLIEWVFTDPDAPEILADWETYALGLAHNMHITGATLFAPGRYETIAAVCAASPEWDRLLAKEFPAHSVLNETLRINAPSFGAEETYLIRIDRPEFPRRPWFTYRLVPKPLAQAA